MTGWRRVFICSVVASLAAGAPLTDLIEAGFDAETLGLAAGPDRRGHRAARQAAHESSSCWSWRR